MGVDAESRAEDEIATDEDSDKGSEDGGRADELEDDMFRKEMNGQNYNAEDQT